MKISKNKKIIIKDLDLTKTYEPIEAIKILKDKSYVKFDETIDVAVNLGIDSNKTDQNIKGVINLPKGTGKKINISVVTSEEKQKDAKENGADQVGGKELIEISIVSLNFTYDFSFKILIASSGS